MKSNIQNDQDKKDWFFVLQQANNGDKKAKEIYGTFEFITNQLNECFREIKDCLPAYRFIYWDKINRLQDEKSYLLIKYKIRAKRAKLYLDSLRKEK